MLFSGVPFIGFGLLDNTIMLTAVSTSYSLFLNIFIVFTIFIDITQKYLPW